MSKKKLRRMNRLTVAELKQVRARSYYWDTHTSVRILLILLPLHSSWWHVQMWWRCMT